MGKDVEESPMGDTTASSSNVETTKESSNECKICGAQAEHSNYGLRTCSPCKMFFKRNAITGQVS
jgi:ribosomal protein L37AE/L43A